MTDRLKNGSRNVSKSSDRIRPAVNDMVNQDHPNGDSADAIEFRNPAVIMAFGDFRLAYWRRNS